MDMFVNDLNETMGPVLSGCIRELRGNSISDTLYGSLKNTVYFETNCTLKNLFVSYHQVKQVWHTAMKLGENMERRESFFPFSL